MKYETADLVRGIRAAAESLGEIFMMEVCGTHTASIRKYGIPSVLPENIRLVSGPGCPVCVTPEKDIAAAVAIADRDDVIFTCFGDMMRVPCGSGSLWALREKGRDIRLVTSPADSLETALENPEKEVVYFGIGFETTAPHSAALIEKAKVKNVSNLSVINVHKTMPAAVESLLSGKSRIDALICPGHVASVTGSEPFMNTARRLKIAAAVSGFEAYDILACILKITDMLARKQTGCVNMYPRAVTKEGNKKAKELIYEVFEPCAALWRGLGVIEESGLKIRKEYARFDAQNRFETPQNECAEPSGCICALILRGERLPVDCPNFGKSCTPDFPKGPCMVSFEGSCSVYYSYTGDAYGR